MATLFATTVASAKPTSKDYKLSDGAGLYLLVRPNGSKLWRFNYVHHGKHRTLAFGAWPEVGLADARGKRDEARRLVAAGLDPSHEEKVARAKARVEENDTFKTVAKEWIAKNERENMAEITLSKIRWLLDMAYPKIGNRPIAKITTQEVLAVLRSVEATGRYESARRMRSVLGRVFRYAVATTRAERDPTGDLRGALTVPKAKHHAAITNPKRAGELMRAIEGYTGHAITLYPSGCPRKSCWSICCTISIGCRKTDRQCFRACSSGRRKWIVPASPRQSRILAPHEPNASSPLFSNEPDGARHREYPMCGAVGHSPRFK